MGLSQEERRVIKKKRKLQGKEREEERGREHMHMWNEFGGPLSGLIFFGPFSPLETVSCRPYLPQDIVSTRPTIKLT